MPSRPRAGLALTLACAPSRQVKLTVGEYTNLKLTTPEDMIIAETILRDRGERRSLGSRIAGLFGK